MCANTIYYCTISFFLTPFISQNRILKQAHTLMPDDLAPPRGPLLAHHPAAAAAAAAARAAVAVAVPAAPRARDVLAEHLALAVQAREVHLAPLHALQHLERRGAVLEHEPQLRGLQVPEKFKGRCQQNDRSCPAK